MKVGIIQSNFIPWRGYFDFINSVDIFIFHDTLQYTKSDWRNRNYIKTQTGTSMITVPVRYKHVSQRIDETLIDYSGHWLKKMANKFRQAYNLTPFYEIYFDSFFSMLNEQHDTISSLNQRIILWFMKKLDIKTTIMSSTEFSPVGTKTFRIIDILQKINAATYVSGPAAASYLDIKLFSESGIGLEYKTYDYNPYPQLYPPFVGNVSILDLLFNVGPEAKNCITSKTPNTVVFSPASNPKRIYA